MRPYRNAVEFAVGTLHEASAKQGYGILKADAS